MTAMSTDHRSPYRSGLARYEPGGDVLVQTNPESLKYRLPDAAGEFSPVVKARAGGRSRPSVPWTGRFCCWMYWCSALIGAPPVEPAKYDPDQSRRACQQWRAGSGNSCRIRRDDTSLRLLTSFETDFFASVTGTRTGRKVAPPWLRSRRDNRQAVRFTRDARFAVLGNGRLRLPKTGDLDVRWSRELPAEPFSVTIVKDVAGRYLASFVVTTKQEVAAPRFLRQAARRLRRLRKSLSRKVKRSNNRRKAVYVEELCVTGPARARLAESVHDAGRAGFTCMLGYRPARYGRVFARIDPVRAHVADVLGARTDRRAGTAVRTDVDVPVRCHP